ncbi:DNA-binding transcriptional LysR family regulator [Catenulispora sp. MAP12-49]|uniref:LysR family transcriptional regulator n=1 Tax=unclassified Catenulispora TaxID=414885 RepID=UPI0035196C75
MTDLAPSELRLLVAVARMGSFTAAAEVSGTSQSAVSHAIRGVERKVGAVLFERGRAGARPTPAGERAVVRARQVLRQLELLGAEARGAEEGTVSGTLRVAAFRSAAAVLLPPAIIGLGARYPGVTPRVLVVPELGAGTVGEVEEGRADLAIATLDEDTAAPDGLVVGELLREPYVLAYPATRRKPQGLPLIDWPENCSSYTRDWWRTQDFLPKATLEVADDGVVLSMIAQGVGMAILPRLTVTGPVAGVTVESLGPHAPTRRIVSVATRADAKAAAPRELVRLLRGVAREMLA